MEYTQIITAKYGFLVGEHAILLDLEWYSQSIAAFWGAAIVVFLAKIINLHNPFTQ